MGKCTLLGSVDVSWRYFFSLSFFPLSSFSHKFSYKKNQIQHFGISIDLERSGVLHGAAKSSPSSGKSPVVPISMVGLAPHPHCAWLVLFIIFNFFCWSELLPAGVSFIEIYLRTQLHAKGSGCVQLSVSFAFLWNNSSSSQEAKSNKRGIMCYPYLCCHEAGGWVWSGPQHPLASVSWLFIGSCDFCLFSWVSTERHLPHV